MTQLTPPLQPLLAATGGGTVITTIIWLLGVVALVAVVTRFVRVPYTVALVVAGLALGVFGGVFAVPLTEGVILEVFLPALLFEAAYNLPWSRLRAEIRTVTALAIPGVIAGTFIVGGIVHLAGLPWPVALVFGALIAATDPVSVLATFRQLGTDRRLSIVVEGESLFNDGTALVVFRIVLAIAITGSISVAGTIASFAISIIGGIFGGLAVGYLAALALRQIDDYLIEITATLLMAYGTFILAERLTFAWRGVEIGMSPVIAVVVLGLVTGNFASRQSMSPATRISMHSTWELIGYLANSLIFLLIGLQIHTAELSLTDIPLVLVAIVATLISRALIVYGVSGAINLRTDPAHRLPLRFQHVILWGGLRGAVALAAALSIPAAAIAERPTLLLMTFGVVIFTLLVQGVTIRPLVAALGLNERGRGGHLDALERVQGQIATTQAARRVLMESKEAGEIGANVYDQLSGAYDARAARLHNELANLHVSTEELAAERARVVQRKALQAEKDTLITLHNRGTITGGVYRALLAEVEGRILQLEGGSARPEDLDRALVDGETPQATAALAEEPSSPLGPLSIAHRLEHSEGMYGDGEGEGKGK